MAKPPAFQWYVKDAATDEKVRAMDDREYGFYMRCLEHSWLNDGLPGNLEELARVLNRPARYVKQVWERVGLCWNLGEDGRFRNSKQESQRVTVRQFLDSRKKAADTRWSKRVESISNARASNVQCSPTASSSASATTTNGKGEGRAEPGPIKTMPLAVEFPLTAQAIRKYFPATDDQFIVMVAHESVRAYVDVVNGRDMPELTDYQISEGVHEAFFPKQQSAGIFKTSVPRCIRSWTEEALRSASTR